MSSLSKGTPLTQDPSSLRPSPSFVRVYLSAHQLYWKAYHDYISRDRTCEFLSARFYDGIPEFELTHREWCGNS